METLQASTETSAVNSQTPEEADLNNLAISFSGGGYRASAFHLGSLDLLEKVGLLNKVTMLSTVSGGSITGAKYACALSKAIANNNPDFYESFYNELYTFILDTRLPDLWTALFSKINNFFKQAAAIPDGSLNSTQETNSFIASLQEIIVDWKSFIKTAGNLSVVDLLNMGGIRLLSLSSLFLALLKGQRRQSYEFLDELQKTDVLARKLRQKYGDLEELKDCKKNQCCQ